MPGNPAPLLGVGEVAALLGVTPRLVRALRSRRELPAILVGRLVRFDPRDVEAFVAARRQPALSGVLAERPKRTSRRSTTAATAAR